MSADKIIRVIRVPFIWMNTISSTLTTVYKIKTEFGKDEAKIERERNKKGRFIIAANDIRLDNNEALKEYKGQQSVERASDS